MAIKNQDTKFQTPTLTSGHHVWYTHCVFQDEWRENLNSSDKRCTPVYNSVQAKFSLYVPRVSLKRKTPTPGQNPDSGGLQLHTPDPASPGSRVCPFTAAWPAILYWFNSTNAFYYPTEVLPTGPPLCIHQFLPLEKFSAGARVSQCLLTNGQHIKFMLYLIWHQLPRHRIRQHKIIRHQLRSTDSHAFWIFFGLFTYQKTQLLAKGTRRLHKPQANSDSLAVISAQRPAYCFNIWKYTRYDLTTFPVDGSTADVAKR